jgi:KDO2-lipid IV(A) lauroyltransferase
MTDFLRTPSREELESLLQVEGADHVYDALKTGKGVVFLTAHLGNFEFLPRYIAHTFCPLTVVARAPEDPEFADFVHHLRESGGYRVIYRGSRTLREMLTLLKRNEGVGLLPDQNSGDLFVPFLGVPAGTVAGPASLALHTGATLIPCYCVRQLDNTYRLLFLSPIAPTPTGDKQADTVRIMTAVNFALEEIVREYPDQWLWLHNRWKSAFEETNQERAFPHGIPDELQQRWHL